MDKTEIFLENGIKKTVSCIFYLYNSNYYFLFTENEKDENGYIKLYLAKVGKETVNSENGPVETGNMIGIEIQTDNEWKEVQGSISKIVNSKKTKVEDPSIQYLPVNMLVNLKIVSKKTFRLLSDIIEKDFGVSLNETESETQVENKLNMDELNETTEKNEDFSSQTDISLVENDMPISEMKNENSNVSSDVLQTDKLIDELDHNIDSSNKINTENESSEMQDSFEIATGEVETEEDYEQSDIIIDYRTKFFEEQEKNKKLQEEIEKLKNILSNIKEIIDTN